MQEILLKILGFFSLCLFGIVHKDRNRPFLRKSPAVVDPVLVPLLVGARLAEELQLHLLELAGAEDEVARRDLVAEGLADLADAEGRPKRANAARQI